MKLRCRPNGPWKNYFCTEYPVRIPGAWPLLSASGKLVGTAVGPCIEKRDLATTLDISKPAASDTARRKDPMKSQQRQKPEAPPWYAVLIPTARKIDEPPTSFSYGAATLASNYTTFTVKFFHRVIVRGYSNEMTLGQIHSEIVLLIF